MPGTDQVDDRTLGARHELELAVEGREALVDLELVLQQRIQALELGVIPQELGFIAYFSASYHQALDQQHCTDMLQVPASIASNTAGTFQLPGKRVDVVEIAGESGLVVGKKKALRQRLGNQQQPFQAPRLDDQRAFLQPFGPRRIDANVELLGLHALVGIFSSR